MNFFEHLQRSDLPRVEYPFVSRSKRLGDRLLSTYLKRFNSRLQPMKPIALVNGMATYDLTQPPMESEAGSRVLRSGFDYVVRKKPASPIAMVFMLNAACNMKCLHCSARNHMGPDRKPLEYAEIIDLADQFVEMGGSAFVITGGEPTLHPRLLDIIDHVDKSKAVVSMFTNGFKIEEMADELLSAGLFSALVSLDSDQAAVHDERRQTAGAFDQAVNGVKRMRELGALVGISTYMTRPDLHDGYFDRVVDLGTGLGVQQIFMFDCVPTGAMLHERERVLTPDDRAHLRELVKGQNAAPSGPAIMGQSWVNSPEGFGCFAGFHQLYVTATGDVAPCDFTPITFGNVREERLQVVWDRMRASEEWGERFMDCRMQDPEFRANTVDLLGDDNDTWPVPYEKILELRAERDRTS